MTLQLKTLVITTSLLLGACVSGPFGGTYKSVDREEYTSDGKLQTVSTAKSFESGVIKAFPDIPIPSTHKIDLEKSVIFTSPTQTVGKITLEGAGDVDSLFRFFEEQMVASGWSPVNAFESATSSMYFAKPGRFVAIIIESAGQGGSRVFINVGPE